jgi:hypothetical protein
MESMPERASMEWLRVPKVKRYRLSSLLSLKGSYLMNHPDYQSCRTRRL